KILVRLPDRSRLVIERRYFLFGRTLRLTHDGTPVPGSADHPGSLRRRAVGLLALLFVVNCLLAAGFLRTDMGGAAAMSAVVYLFMVVPYVMWWRSAAIAVAILLGIDGLLSASILLINASWLAVVMLVMKAGLFVEFWRTARGFVRTRQ